MAKNFRKITIEITHKNDDESVDIHTSGKGLGEMLNRLSTNKTIDEPLENAVGAIFGALAQNAEYIKPKGMEARKNSAITKEKT